MEYSKDDFFLLLTDNSMTAVHFYRDTNKMMTIVIKLARRKLIGHIVVTEWAMVVQLYVQQ